MPVYQILYTSKNSSINSFQNGKTFRQLLMRVGCCQPLPLSLAAGIVEMIHISMRDDVTFKGLGEEVSLVLDRI